MLSLQDLDRVVHRHGWGSLSEWAEGIDRLADLSDLELEELARLDPCKAAVEHP
jgi:hypothetical protein